MIEYVAAAFVASALVSVTEYRVTDLGALAGDASALPPGTTAAAINNDARIVGASVLSGVNADFRAYLWNGGVMSELMRPLMLGQSQAFAINEHGDVAGVAFQLGELLPTAMTWTPAGVPAMLGHFVPQDISDGGDIVGVMPTDASGLHWVAAQWQAGALTALPDLGGSDSVARAIGDDGRIVGGATPSGEFAHRAVLWQNGAVIDLGTPGGATSEAFDISPAGRIVGHGRTTTGAVRAFMADVDGAGQVTSFTTLPAIDDTFAYARAINDSHLVVGTSNSRATRWDATGAMTNLNDVIPPGSAWNLTHATDVNDRGQIVGRGTHLGRPRAFLLTPIDLCPGDADGNLVVDFADLNLVLDDWATTPGQGGDVDGDGNVNFDDLNLVLEWWGNDCR